MLEFLGVCNGKPPHASIYYRSQFLVEDMNMYSTANAASTKPDKKKNGCCCGPSSDAPKNTATETCKTAVAAEQGFAAKELVGEKSHDCCGAHQLDEVQPSKLGYEIQGDPT